MPVPMRNRRKQRRRISDPKHEVCLWPEISYREDMQVEEWIVYDSKVEKLHRFETKKEALEFMDTIIKQDPQTTKI